MTRCDPDNDAISPNNTTNHSCDSPYKHNQLTNTWQNYIYFPPSYKSGYVLLVYFSTIFFSCYLKSMTILNTRRLLSSLGHILYSFLTLSYHKGLDHRSIAHKLIAIYTQQMPMEIRLCMAIDAYVSLTSYGGRERKKKKKV